MRGCITLLDALKALRTHVPRPWYGICSNVAHVVTLYTGIDVLGYDCEDELIELFGEMGLDCKYPVADPCGGGARDIYLNADNKWSGAYGDARRALLNDCITYLESRE